MKLPSDIKTLVRSALEEDKAQSDITTLGLGIGSLGVEAKIVAKEKGVLAGLEVAILVFKSLGKVNYESNFEDGAELKIGDEVLSLKAKAGVILSGERTALNFLSHLSGVATATKRLQGRLPEKKIKIYDTRKTIPGLRILEKYAVRMGGGYNHRLDLSRSIILKDNHINIFREIHPEDDYLVQMVRKLRRKYPAKELILEVHSLEEWRQAIEAEPDVVMFDNWKIEDIKSALRMLKGRRKFEIEISGRVNLSQLQKLRDLKIDRISIGSITHSAQALDFSLEIKN